MWGGEAARKNQPLVREDHLCMEVKGALGNFYELQKVPSSQVDVFVFIHFFVRVMSGLSTLTGLHCYTYIYIIY